MKSKEQREKGRETEDRMKMNGGEKEEEREEQERGMKVL